MKLRRLIGWSLLVFILDQASKLWVQSNLTLGDTIPVIPNIFDLVHITNRGAAFGILSGMADPYRFIILTVISAVAVAVIILYYWSVPSDRKAIQIPLALIMGGAAGNIFDRIVHGAVVDFLSFHWYNRWARLDLFGYPFHFKLEWPAFNIADMAITCSVLWLIVAMLLRPIDKAAQES